MNENPFNIQSIHHNAYATSNIAATIRFWRDLLGFKMVLSYEVGRTAQYFFGINQSVFISFFYWPGVKKVPNKRHGEAVDGTFNFDHTAFELEKFEDLQILQNKFMENDLPITDIIDHGFLYSIYSFDPNGIPLEFNTSQKKYNVYLQPKLTAGENKHQKANPDFTKWKNTNDSWFEIDPTIIPGEGHQFFKSHEDE